MAFPQQTNELSDATPRAAEQTRSAFRALALSIGGAAMASLLMALLVVPWTGVRAIFPATVLLLPLALLVHATLAVASRLAARFGVEVPAYLHLCALVLGFSLALMTFAINRAMIDDPLGRNKLLAYAAGGMLLAGLLLVPLLRLRRARLTRNVQLVVLLMLACLLGLVDATFLPEDLPLAHVGVAAVALTYFCAFVRTYTKWRGSHLAYISVLGLLGSALLSALAPLDVPYQDMALSRTYQMRLLRAARLTADRDGDDFSAALGGGDCDDGDRTAYPLSNKGRDCLGWIRGTTGAVAPPKLESMTAAPFAPRVIVLATIDAFRCGFGQMETEPRLMNACPELTKLAAEGRLRLDAHTTCSRTSKAVVGLNRSDPRNYSKRSEGPYFLPQSMKALGYETHVLVAHHNQVERGIDRAYDKVDRSLERRMLEPYASNADLVTARAVATIDAHLVASTKPLFLWVHYFDPHSPYVHPPGSPLALKHGRIERYAEEVGRADRAIRDLAQHLRRLSTAHGSLLFVTADHGEEFDEAHAVVRPTSYHGQSLNEPVVRIPMLAWSPSAEIANALPADLPGSLADVGPFLVAATQGLPFQPPKNAFFAIDTSFDRLVGLYEAGWKLVYHRRANLITLYDLRTDPLERQNLTASHPERVQALGESLGGYILSPSQASNPH